jgi:hypothetical protein
MAKALARREGARTATPRVATVPVRTLEQIAQENATEGCVRETFGALVATHQAGAARDPLLRATMARIARDETRHAALSWKVAAWLNGRLDPAARARVEEAKRLAVEELAGDTRTDRGKELAKAGLPSSEQATVLVTQLKRTLWT